MSDDNTPRRETLDLMAVLKGSLDSRGTAERTVPDNSGPRPRLFLGHPCRQKGCGTLAFYRVTGPHGTMWYCLEHAAQYREIMAALSCSVHVELITEELTEPEAAPEEIVETWTCGSCLARGELRFAPSTTMLEYREQLRAAHQEESPSCSALDVYSRLYDRRKTAVLR